jgi:heme oxygenase (biliverdin-IX-beta and delta-forming)
MSAIDSTPATKRPEGPRAGRALDRLREETSAAHGALDETLQIVDRLSATDQRAGLLAGYHFLHQEIETKVAPFLGGIADLDFYARRRSSLVAVGLGSPGQSALADGTARAFSSEVDTDSREENASKQESRAPFRFDRNGKGSSLDIHTRAEALGALYVLEGSSLGGRVILKELKRRGASLAGLGFLDPYGADTGKRWRSFLIILERELTSCEQKADAVKGALNTFAFANACLRKESTN